MCTCAELHMRRWQFQSDRFVRNSDLAPVKFAADCTNGCFSCCDAADGFGPSGCCICERKAGSLPRWARSSRSAGIVPTTASVSRMSAQEAKLRQWQDHLNSRNDRFRDRGGMRPAASPQVRFEPKADSQFLSSSHPRHLAVRLGEPCCSVKSGSSCSPQQGTKALRLTCGLTGRPPKSV